MKHCFEHNVQWGSVLSMRLDVHLQEEYPDVSRAQLQRLIKAGSVFVNGKSETKNGFKLREFDTVTLEYDFTAPIVFQHIEIPILYEDADCVVINKPLGTLTHSKGAFNPEPTVATWLAERPSFDLVNDDVNMRSGIVHRLDRATSGVMICAKNQEALTHLQKQFQDRKAKKTYAARIAGLIEPLRAMIDLPIERNPKQPQRFRVGHNGKPSQTEYEVIKTVDQKGDVDTILELKPTTGRTHQLRVHLEYLKRPIVGDVFYDGRVADRLYLHAHKLEITLPNKRRQTFEADIPEDFYKTDIV